MNWDSSAGQNSQFSMFGLPHPESHFHPEMTRKERAELALVTLHRLRETSLLHPRRTLDQFYYSSLKNPEYRDSHQTVSKWTGDHVDEGGNASATNSSLLIMVDQLWCWVLDESKSKTCPNTHLPVL
jgi:hypothetical protein